MWPVVDAEEMLPTTYKGGPGKPKKLRRREPDEPEPKQNKRQVIKYKCTKCGEFGHNNRSCKSTTINPETHNRNV